MTIIRTTVLTLVLSLCSASFVVAQEDASTQDKVVFSSLDVSDLALFANDSVELTEDGLITLQVLFNVISEYTNITDIKITGHTSARGPQKYNQRLSEKRAATVARLFATRYPAAKITAIGRGEDQPIASNDNARDEARNRRVEVEITASLRTAR